MRGIIVKLFAEHGLVDSGDGVWLFRFSDVLVNEEEIAVGREVDFELGENNGVPPRAIDLAIRPPLFAME